MQRVSMHERHGEMLAALVAAAAAALEGYRALGVTGY
jgi:hypothetical protein